MNEMPRCERENAGKYVGMDRFDARKAIVKDLQDRGYMLKIDPIVHSVGHSERTGVLPNPACRPSGS